MLAWPSGLTSSIRTRRFLQNIVCSPCRHASVLPLAPFFVLVAFVRTFPFREQRTTPSAPAPLARPSPVTAWTHSAGTACTSGSSGHMPALLRRDRGASSWLPLFPNRLQGRSSLHDASMITRPSALQRSSDVRQRCAAANQSAPIARRTEAAEGVECLWVPAAASSPC